MSNMLSRGIAYLDARLKAKASLRVTYSRDNVTLGADPQNPLYATLGKKMLKVTDDTGHVQILFADRDFIFTAADLLPTFGTPLKGDKIRMVVGAVTEVYAALPPSPGEPEYQLDPTGIRLRVFVKRTATE